MKNEKGVTLAALVITVIIIFILASISINYGVDTLNESKNKNLEASLAIVEQAVAEQYMKSVELGVASTKVDKIDTNDTKKPSVFVGKRLKNESDFPTDVDLKNKSNVLDTSNDNLTYADCYYKLEPEDLISLKIESDEDNKYTYIVNYSTGEVFNETKKKTSDGTLLYYSGKTGNTDTPAVEIDKEGDSSSFSDIDE